MTTLPNFKIVVADGISTQGVDFFQEKNNVQVIFEPKCTPEELKVYLKDADALVVRSRTKVTHDILDSAPKLKVIGRAGAGVDNIDTKAATEKGVVVMNTPGSNTISAAEHAMGMLLSMMRQIPQAHASMQEKKWEKSRFMGDELFEKKLGILGLGRIGREVAKRAQAFGMDILAYDPFLTQETAMDLGVKLVGVKEILSQSNILTLHMSLTEETHHFLNEERLNQCQAGVKIVNCGRGELVDEKALAKALQSGHVAACALDVFEQEPLGDSPLLSINRVTTTPHLAASTVEAQVRVGVGICKQIFDFLSQGVILNAVNFPSLSVTEYKKLSPYLKLAEAMGSFAAQISSPPIQEIEVCSFGGLTQANSKPVTTAALFGFLKVFLKEGVNIVNARHIAEERAIQLKETESSEKRGYPSVLRITTRGQEGSIAVEGIVHSSEQTETDIRIISLEGNPIEVPLSAHMLLLNNKDVPGVIGQIGTVLGNNQINIANFSLGRRGTSDAVAVLNIDNSCTESTLEELRNIEAIVSIKSIEI